MKAIALDTETTSLDLRGGAQVFAVSACDHAGNIWFWEWPVFIPPTREDSVSVDYSGQRTEEFRALVFSKAREGYSLVFHNAKFDLYAIHKLLFPDTSPLDDSWIPWDQIHDTMLMAKAIQSDSHLGLKELAQIHLDLPPIEYLNLIDAVQSAYRLAASYPDLFGSMPAPIHKTHSSSFYLPGWVSRNCDLARLDRRKDCKVIKGIISKFKSVLRSYSIGDAVRTIRLFLLFYNVLQQDQDASSSYSRERSILPHIYRMEHRGVSVISKSFSKVFSTLSNEVSASMSKLHKFAGSSFNPSSPKQVSDYLFVKLRCEPPLLTDKGAPSTSAEALAEIASSSKMRLAKSFCECMLHYRKHITALRYLDSYKSSTRDPYPGHPLYGMRVPVIHTSLNQAGTRTTRFSSSEPNLENVGKRDDTLKSLRSLFGPAPGVTWYDLDYDQLELRIFAVASQDQFLLDAYRQGLDVHRLVACEVFNTSSPTDAQRRAAKSLNFGLLYGMGEDRCIALTGSKSAYRRFQSRLKTASSYMKSVISHVRRHGWVRTLAGTRLYVPPDRAYAGLNYIIQGTAGDILKEAIRLIGCHSSLDTPSIILPIHDELLIEYRRKPEKHERSIANHLSSLMESAGSIAGVSTPVTVSIIHHSWDNPEPIPHHIPYSRRLP